MDLSTFFNNNNNEDELRKVSMSYVPKITNKLKSKFREHNMQIVFRNDKKLINLLGTTKDKIDEFDKKGIYSISCGDCDKKYYGQTKRNIKQRFKEHSSYIAKNEGRKSAIAEHVLDNGHFNVTINNVKLEKQVYDDRKLDAFESYYIQKDSNSLNKDNGNIESILFARL